MAFLFAITLFLSATLLFLIEPMIAKMILPLLGGTPAVWNTCMVFFQAALLVGYAYAHAATDRLSTRRQVLLQLLVLFLPFVVFPIRLVSGWLPPGDANPIPWLLAMLLVSIGLPFFVLATSAPLLQKWFTHTGHASAKDPYFLYAASNLGSMLALLGYPVVVEPNLALKPDGFNWLSQSWLWTAGYGLFVLCTLACARVVWRSPHEPDKVTKKQKVKETKQDAASGAQPLSAWQRLRWIALAFVPSSLMLGVTTHITLDIAAVPLLWIIPLALYLLSFILVFAKWPPSVHRTMVMILPLVLLVLVFRMLYTDKKWPISATIALHLLNLFLVALVCHGELARTRPAPRYLTQFYLLLSLGGVLGGLFNALVAPLIFNSVLEYNVALVLACLLLPPAGSEAKSWLTRFFPDSRPELLGILADVILALALGLLAFGLFQFFLTSPDEGSWRAALRDRALPALLWINDHARIDLFGRHLEVDLFRIKKALILGLITLLCYSFVMRPLRFGLGVGAFFFAAFLFAGADYDEPASEHVQLLYQKRSFFGVLKVKRYPDDDEDTYTLTHGTTLHGEEIRKPGQRSEPLTYYHRTGPIGQVFTEFSGSRAKPYVALIGLGSGTLASYGEPGQHLTFYEIDPVVRDIATNENYFTYWRDCLAEKEIVLGDARLRLKEAADRKYGIIVVDAFSSDAIPIHLITREALQLYFQKLTDDGILAVHISNRHLDLQPILGNLAHDLGLVGLRQYDDDTDPRMTPGKSISDWVLLARRREDFGALVEDGRWKAPPFLGASITGLLGSPPGPGSLLAASAVAAGKTRWQPIETNPKVGVWTDDYSNLLSVFLWKK